MADLITTISRDPSLIRTRHWLSVEQAVVEVVTFTRRFGRKHLLLAAHAAFPLLLTPELINLIHHNFLPDRHISPMAEADFLLSPLCRSLGADLFEVEPGVREVLLVELLLQFADGSQRLLDLAHFLQAYLTLTAGRDTPPGLREMQDWIAIAYLQPEALFNQIRQQLENGINDEHNPSAHNPSATLARHIRIATIVELVTDQLEQKLPAGHYTDLIENGRALAQHWYANPDRRLALREAVHPDQIFNRPQRSLLGTTLWWMADKPAPPVKVSVGEMEAALHDYKANMRVASLRAGSPAMLTRSGVAGAVSEFLTSVEQGAHVFRWINDSGRLRAVRCFLSALPAQPDTHLAQINTFFRAQVPTLTVEFAFHRNGFQVPRPNDSPVIMPLLDMEWLEGETLLSRVDYNDPNKRNSETAKFKVGVPHGYDPQNL